MRDGQISQIIEGSAVDLSDVRYSKISKPSATTICEIPNWGTDVKKMSPVGKV